jgi:hypothetical protein
VVVLPACPARGEVPTPPAQVRLPAAGVGWPGRLGCLGWLGRLGLGRLGLDWLGLGRGERLGAGAGEDGLGVAATAGTVAPVAASHPMGSPATAAPRLAARQAPPGVAFWLACAAARADSA